jgi:NADH-quinone oxidoreductase subunit H
MFGVLLYRFFIQAKWVVCFYLLSLVFYIVCFYGGYSLFFLTGITMVFSVLKILFIFIIVAFFTLVERKILGAIHRRRGPSLVGLFGLLQPIADALKLFLKELLYPVRAYNFVFLSAPWWILTLSVVAWFFIPFHFIVFNFEYFIYSDVAASFSSYINIITHIGTFNLRVIDSNFSILILLAISSLNVYGIILAGWSSNSKYAFLGGLRSAAQMISYEVSFGLTIMPVVILTSSLNFININLVQAKSYLFFLLIPSVIIFVISMLAETNRAPFDLPEAEAELVAGYNVEYSAITFAMFFLGEYSNMLLMSSLCTLLFLGGVGGYFYFVLPLKILFVCFLFIIVRASVPRFRYDQLMQLCWKQFLPISMSFFLYYVVLSLWILTYIL